MTTNQNQKKDIRPTTFLEKLEAYFLTREDEWAIKDELTRKEIRAELDEDLELKKIYEKLERDWNKY